jgi:large subunit ribosomal protein L7/L12
MADIQKMLEEIKGMTVLELNELVKAIEEEFGVSAAASVAVAAAPVEAAPAAEEKTEFKVVLKELGEGGVKLIKAIKDVTGLGLMESKALAVAGATIKESASKEEADQIIAKFKEIGATVVAD